MGPSRPLPQVGDAVVVQFLGTEKPGVICEVDERRLRVRTPDGEEWFVLSHITGRFVREGQAYFPRLLWR